MIELRVIKRCLAAANATNEHWSQANDGSYCPGLARWMQMDRHIDYKLQQAGTIDPAPSLRNWRSQAREIYNWGTSWQAYHTSVSENMHLPM